MLSGTTDASGVVQWNVPIPASTSLDGQHFFTQIAIVDAAANGLGGYLSNGTRNILGGKLGITRIWGGISSTGGTLGYNYGMAISFN